MSALANAAGSASVDDAPNWIIKIAVKDVYEPYSVESGLVKIIEFIDGDFSETLSHAPSCRDLKTLRSVIAQVWLTHRLVSWYNAKFCRRRTLLRYRLCETFRTIFQEMF